MTDVPAVDKGASAHGLRSVGDGSGTCNSGGGVDY